MNPDLAIFYARAHQRELLAHAEHVRLVRSLPSTRSRGARLARAAFRRRGADGSPLRASP